MRGLSLQMAALASILALSQANTVAAHIPALKLHARAATTTIPPPDGWLPIQTTLPDSMQSSDAGIPADTSSSSTVYAICLDASNYADRSSLGFFGGLSNRNFSSQTTYTTANVYECCVLCAEDTDCQSGAFSSSNSVCTLEWGATEFDCSAEDPCVGDVLAYADNDGSGYFLDTFNGYFGFWNAYAPTSGGHG